MPWARAAAPSEQARFRRRRRKASRASGLAAVRGGLRSAPVGSTIVPASRAGSAARPGVALIRPTSCVATTTVVPRRLSALNRWSRRLAIVGIDVAGGLIGDEQVGPIDDRPRDRDALLLSAGQRRRPRAGPVGKPDPGQHFPDRALDLVRRVAPAMRSGKATLSNADRCRIRRKSWNTTPMRRRKCGRASRGASVSSSPNSRIRPRVGRWAR